MDLICLLVNLVLPEITHDLHDATSDHEPQETGIEIGPSSARVLVLSCVGHCSDMSLGRSSHNTCGRSSPPTTSGQRLKLHKALRFGP